MHPRALIVRDDGGVRTPWRIVSFVVATICGGMLVAAFVYPVVAATPLVTLARAWRIPLDQLGALLALLFASYVVVRVVEGARGGPWARVALDRRAFNWRAIAIGLGAGTLAILVPCAILLAAGRLRFESQPAVESWWDAARQALLLLVPAALVEELALRGYVLSVLRDAIRAPGAVAVTSVVFALMHLLNPGPTIVSTTVVALAGVFLATVRLATGSLYAAWIAHLAWNLVQAAVLHAPVSGLPVPTPGYRLVDLGPDWLTGGAWGPEGGLAAAAGILVTTFLLVWRPGRVAQLRPAAGGARTRFVPPTWRRDA